MTRKGVLLLLMLAAAPSAMAHAAVVDGGRVNLRGELVNGDAPWRPKAKACGLKWGSIAAKTFPAPAAFLR